MQLMWHWNQAHSRFSTVSTIHTGSPGGRQATEEMSTVTLLASVGVHCRQGSLWKARLRMLCQFTVGLRVQGKADRIVVDAEDALIAALKVKAERPEVAIMYVRRLNRRGDTRHPPHTLTKTDQSQQERP